LLVDWTGHFDAALTIAAMIAVVGGLAWIFGVRKLEQVQWPVLPNALV